MTMKIFSNFRSLWKEAKNLVSDSIDIISESIKELRKPHKDNNQTTSAHFGNVSYNKASSLFSTNRTPTKPKSSSKKEPSLPQATTETIEQRFSKMKEGLTKKPVEGPGLNVDAPSRSPRL